SLSCASNTPELACTFTRSTLQNAMGMSVLTIAPMQNTASFTNFQVNQWLHFAAWTLGILAALILAWPSRPRMAARFVCATLLLGVAGCGAPRIRLFDNGPSPGNYSIIVRAVSSGANAGISHTAELQI